MSSDKKFLIRYPWLAPLEERPVQRKHLAALDFLRGMTLKEIVKKYGYRHKGSVSNDIRRVLSQKQIEARNKKFGAWHGSVRISFRKPRMLERTVDLRMSGLTLMEIAKIERVSVRAVCFRLQHARKLGMYKRKT